MEMSVLIKSNGEPQSTFHCSGVHVGLFLTGPRHTITGLVYVSRSCRSPAVGNPAISPASVIGTKNSTEGIPTMDPIGPDAII